MPGLEKLHKNVMRKVGLLMVNTGYRGGGLQLEKPRDLVLHA